MTTTPQPYSRNAEKRARQLAQNAEYVRQHIYALDDMTALRLIQMFRDMHGQLAALVGQNYYGARSENGNWSANDPAFRQRTESLLSQIRTQIDQLTNNARVMTFDAAQDGYKAGFYGSAWMLDQAVRGNVNIRMPVLPNEAIRAAILNPYGGLTFLDRYADARDKFVQDIRKGIVGSQIAGDSIRDAIKRLAEALGLNPDRSKWDRGLYKRLEMIARTEILRASNNGTMAIYQANTDVLNGWQFITAQDDRVCPECAPLDGRVYALDDTANQPPLHPNCRCDSTPVLINSEIENAIVGPRQDFLSWARDHGISRDRYGNAYNFNAVNSI